MGTSKNHHRSSDAPNLLANDSGLFPFRFCAVHPKDAGYCKPRQFFEVPFCQSGSFEPPAGARCADFHVRPTGSRVSAALSLT
jgi:hypothetical protein